MIQRAVPAHAVGEFRERATVGALHDHFSLVWVHRMPDTGVPPLSICPDATIDIQWIEGELRVAGPDLEPHIEMLPAQTTVIGFRFSPAAASAWLGVPASELLGRRVAMEDLCGRIARKLAATITDEDEPAAVIASLETALANVASKRPVDAAMRAAYRLIEAGPPPQSPLLPWLTRTLGMSERTMRRRFHECFGYGPKSLDRILRYHRFLRLTANSRSSSAALAAEAGYADQAHLIRESKRISGFTLKDRAAGPFR